MHGRSRAVVCARQRAQALMRLRALPVQALDLQALCANSSNSSSSSSSSPSVCSADVALQHMRQVTARIAHCYCAFDDPVVRQRCRAGPYAAPLRSLRASTLRELRHALRLERLTRTRAAHEARHSNNNNNTTTYNNNNNNNNNNNHNDDSSALLLLRTATPCRARTSWRDWFAWGAQLRNTDDLSAIDDTDAPCAATTTTTSVATAVATTAASARHATLSSNGDSDSDSSSVSDGDSGELLSEDVLSVLMSLSDDDTSSSSGSSNVDGDTCDDSVICCSSNGACVAPWHTLSYKLSLQLLESLQSPLDTVVNEGMLHDAQVNAWFARFCRRRVAWRVLHAHLLHCLYPTTHPRVVCSDVAIARVLRDAATAVASTYATLRGNVAGYALTIHIDEDASLLTREPHGIHLCHDDDDDGDACGNNSDHSRRAHDAQSQAHASSPSSSLSSPRASERVFAVDGHLLYVFREVLKNACLASYAHAATATVHVRYATDARWVVVDVVDTAGGIATRDHRRIWTFGWTTAAAGCEAQLGGDGVGLPTSHVYLSMWGGGVDVYTQPGHGTTVRLRYPKSPVEVLVPDAPMAETATAATMTTPCDAHNACARDGSA